MFAGVALYAIRTLGESAVVNALVPLVRGEIVMFADARQRFEPRTVRELVATSPIRTGSTSSTT